MPNKKKYPIDKYHINSDENPCRCFQVTRRIHYNGSPTYEKFTVFLNKENNTLCYLEFNGPNYIFWDEYIAVWKIKSFNQSN
jgi:hypothetical protein